MDSPIANSSERRLVENEAVFRELNQKIHKGYKHTNKLAREDNQPDFLVKSTELDKPLYFFCECADEKCVDRIKINMREYNKIHEERDNFVVLPGHNIAAIERIVAERAGYTVVKKYLDPPEEAGALNPTSLNNSD